MVGAVMSVAMSVIVADAPGASATATEPATVEVSEVMTRTGCWTTQLEFRGHAEPNNVTLGGDVAVAPYGYADCPSPEDQDVAVVDTGATIDAGPGCDAAGSLAECSSSFLVQIYVNTAAGDDTIRIGTLPGFTKTVIYAGAGNDTIRTVNDNGATFPAYSYQAKDVIHCGDGHDVVIADSYDEISSDCEVVQLVAG